MYIFLSIISFRFFFSFVRRSNGSSSSFIIDAIEMCVCVRVVAEELSQCKCQSNVPHVVDLFFLAYPFFSCEEDAFLSPPPSLISLVFWRCQWQGVKCLPMPYAHAGRLWLSIFKKASKKKKQKLMNKLLTTAELRFKALNCLLNMAFYLQ